MVVLFHNNGLSILLLPNIVSLLTPNAPVVDVFLRVQLPNLAFSSRDPRRSTCPCPGKRQDGGPELSQLPPGPKAVAVDHWTSVGRRRELRCLCQSGSPQHHRMTAGPVSSVWIGYIVTLCCIWDDELMRGCPISPDATGCYHTLFRHLLP